MKKILSLFLAVLVAFSGISMALPTATAAEDTDPVITAETVVAQPGEEVDVQLTIKNNPGILGMTLKVTYDESKVTLTGVANGSTLSYMTFTTPKKLSSGCQLPWDAMDVPADQVKDGVIATLTFKVSENAAENEEIEIGVTYDAGAIIDNDMAALTIGMVNGHIRVGSNSQGPTGGSTDNPEGDSTTDPVITAEAVAAHPGEEVEVKLIIKNNPGILGMTLKVTYDESKATLTGVANGSTLSYMTFTTPKKLSSGCQLPWDAMEVPADQVKDGVIATLTFKVSENAAENEEIEIGVTYDAGAIIDNDMAPLTIGMVNGQITVKSEQEDVPVTIVPELVGKSFTLSFDDEILVNFYYQVAKADDVVDTGMAVFYEAPDGEFDLESADEIYENPIYNPGTDRYMCQTKGIAAKQMGDSRYYVAYAKLTDDTYVYSQAYDYSPRKYAMNMLGKASTSEKQKALCVAMLNYGAAAQTYFGHNVDNLMNSALTAEQKALIIGYDKSLFVGAVAAPAEKVGAFTRSSTGFSSRIATVSFEGALAINYYFTPNQSVSGDMTFYYWTPEAYATVDVLTAANATGSCTMVKNGGAYFAQITGIAAKNLDKTYYVAGVYTDNAGNTYCTGVIAYSLSRYCMNNASGNMSALAQATAMYGYYAAQYFTK